MNQDLMPRQNIEVHSLIAISMVFQYLTISVE